MFMLEIGAFYPFATAINSNNEIVPIGAYIEDKNDTPASQDIINLLEKGIFHEINNGYYRIAAIVVDITITKKTVNYDAMQIRFYEKNNAYKKHFIYVINSNNVMFTEVQESL